MTKPSYVQEHKAITDVLNKYIDGCKQANSSIMKPAFSDQATMFSVGADGKLAGGAIQNLFDGVDKYFVRRLKLRAPSSASKSSGLPPAPALTPTMFPVSASPIFSIC